jgi:hypothetical protein
MPANGPPLLAKALYKRILASPDRATCLKGLVNSTQLTFETQWSVPKVSGLPVVYSRGESMIRDTFSSSVSAFLPT